MNGPAIESDHYLVGKLAGLELMRAQNDVTRGVARRCAGHVTKLHLVRARQQRTHLMKREREKEGTSHMLTVNMTALHSRAV